MAPYRGDIKLPLEVVVLTLAGGFDIFQSSQMLQKRNNLECWERIKQ